MESRATITLYTSASAPDRIDRARAFLGRLPPLTESVIVGATREATDDFVRRFTRTAGACFGAHRFGVMQLASRIAAPELARLGITPLTSTGAEALAARAVFDAQSAGELPYFEPVAQTNGFARSVAATLHDLRLGGLAAGHLDGSHPSLDDLGALLQRYTALLEEGRTADRARLLQIATGTLLRGETSFPARRPLIWLDAPVSTVAEQRFLRALCGTRSLAFIALPAGDTRSIAVVQELENLPADLDVKAGRRGHLGEHLFSEASALSESRGSAVHFFSAPGEGRECIEIARLILDEARGGARFDTIAVALRSPELYSELLRAALSRAGVPAWFSRGTTLPDPSGRAFLALLACADERLSAHRFAEYLSLAQVPDLDEGGVPPAAGDHWATPSDDDGVLHDVARTEPDRDDDEASRWSSTPPEDDDSAPVLEGSLRTPWNWDRLLVESAVIGGLERWRRRLAGLARELELAIAESQREEPDSPRARKLQRDLIDLQHLQRFALPVIGLLDALPREALWGVWLDALSSLAPRVLRRPSRVLQVLAELRAMASVGPATMQEVRVVLTARLRTLRDEPPRRRYGRVLVCTIDELPGRSVDVLFVPGMAERLFPQKQREDPLLLDEVRRALNQRVATETGGAVPLATVDDRVAAERLRLQLAAGAAGARLYFSYPRMEMTESRPRVPSFYALEVDRAQRGRIPEPDEFQRRTDNAVQARLAWPAPVDPDRAIDDAEHDLAVIHPLLRQRRDQVLGRARYLLDLNDALGRSLRSRWQRWTQSRWSAADGMFAPGAAVREALQERSLQARPYSVSALQKFAVCPYQFYLSAVLKLAPRDEIRRIERLDPLTRGSIVHRIQAELTRLVMEIIGSAEPHGTGPGAPGLRINDHLDRFRRATDAIVSEFHETLSPAIERVWRDEVDEIAGDVREWLRRMTADLGQWRPLHAEFGFGFAASALRDPLSQPEPVVLDGGWQLHGVVDLIEERSGGASLRVTDHKTGSNRTKPGMVVAGGETLQPVLYGLAVEAALGKPVAEARLSFCTSRGGFTERTVPLGPAQRRSGAEVLEIVDRALQAGTLVPAPRAGACEWCDFRPVCGPHEEARSRFKDAAALADLHSLRKLS